MHISVFYFVPIKTPTYSIQTLIPSGSEATTVLVCWLQVLLKGV